MPSPVIALIGACAFGEYSTLLLLHTRNGPCRVYLHELGELAVMHTMPVQDVHRFDALDGRAGVLRVMDGLLSLNAQTPAAIPAGKVLTVDAQAARDAARAGRVDEAIGLLARGGLPPTTAWNLGRAMKEATALGAISIVKRSADGQLSRATLAVVITPTSCFALSDEDTRPATFHVRPTSADALREWITSSLPMTLRES